jgi:hypothetical protein
LTFFDRPILNSPYLPPRLHHVLDQDGQPLDVPPADGRRESKFISPVPKSRKQRAKTGQGSLAFGDSSGVSTPEQEYNPTPIINEIRSHVASWREFRNPADWGVTPATARLLMHWRHHNYESVRPCFCQVEAETVIWLTEVGRRERRYGKFWVRSGDTKSIAAWFIDTAYDEENFFVRHAYFLGTNNPYKSLKTALQAEIDEDAWATLYSDTSRPFARPAGGRIAVKVINHFGDEVMKVFGV